MRIFESIILGILAACGALLTETLFSVLFEILINKDVQNAQIDAILQSPFEITFSFIFIFASAIILEEIFKYIVIVKRVDKYSMEINLLLNSFIVGFGFFLLEFLFIAGQLDFHAGTLMNYWHNLVEIAIVHITTAGYIGYVIAIRNPKKAKTFCSAMLGAIFFHAIYNIMVIFPIPYLLPVKYAFLLFLITLSFANIIRINKELAY